MIVKIKRYWKHNDNKTVRESEEDIKRDISFTLHEVIQLRLEQILTDEHGIYKVSGSFVIETRDGYSNLVRYRQIIVSEECEEDVE